MKKPLWLFLGLGLLLGSCKSSREVFTPPVIINETSVSNAVSGDLALEKAPDWAPKDYGYHPSRTRHFDLLHTGLDLRFDWEKRRVIGKATLKLKPYFYPQSQLRLDAQNFDLHQVAMVRGGEKQELIYAYDSLQLVIDLGQEYTRNDTLTIWIDYTAKPYERETGGGQAITSDRGLYFVNHDGSDPSVPMQIWTQGETQSNSCWFPTIDSPNERCTQEIKLTVAERFLTVSNGRKASSTSHPDGTRTDVWVQDQPHSPYLFALVAGDFREVKDEWRGKEVNYYVEPAYEPFAKAVFGHTPEMLEFFSNRLGVEYPWDKYAQIVVRDFVSGAMENTGCVIFYDVLNQDKGENIDSPQDDIIAHELFHHWFGDLVGCESWANLTLNESFASYGEYLWFEHKEGKARADYHLMNDFHLYLRESMTKREPIVRYGYKNPDDMFDRHSYQKGACVLHMLRTYVGDEAFFTALNRYLNRYAHQAAEIHQLRLVFEEVTGEDLNWFFNQWFLSPGHPELKVRFEQELELSNTQAAGRRLLKVEVSQTQNLRYMPVFRLPTTLEVRYADGSHTLHPVVLQSGDSVFTLEVEQPVSHVNFDGEGMLLAQIDEQYEDLNAAIVELRYGTQLRNRFRALFALSDYTEDEAVQEVMLEVLRDSFPELREQALWALRKVEGPRLLQTLREMLRLSAEDPHPAVRAVAVAGFASDAVQRVVEAKDLTSEVSAMAQRALRDSSYRVQSRGFAVLQRYEPERALTIARELGAVRNTALLAQSTLLLMNADDLAAGKQVLLNLEQMPFGMEKIQLLSDLPAYLLRQSPETLSDGVDFLKKAATEEAHWMWRFTAIQALEELDEVEGVKEFFRRQAEVEENAVIREYLQSLK